MSEQFEPVATPPVQPVGRTSRRLGTFFFVLALLLMMFFGYKVFTYYRQLQLGTLDVSSLSFQTTAATQNRLVAIAQAAPGSGELATTDDPSVGPADAKLTIVQFADFGCPFSEQESYAVTAIARQYPDDVRIIYRDFPLVDIHPGADLAAQAGGCAHEQGKFWEYHDVLFRNSGTFTEDSLIDYAGQIDLDMNKFRVCLQTGKYEEEVAQDLADGVAAGVAGTPTFFMNGEKIDGAIPFSAFKDIVNAFLE
ncbi:MAG: thioredoxin domain-containing protein [Patescibacteria group bacterium]